MPIATNKWSKITVDTRQPDPRYGHYAFMYSGDLYVYGGISFGRGLVELWRFNGTVWTLQQPNNPDKPPPTGTRGPACVVVTNNNSTKLYVFGGLDAAGVAARDLNVYDISK